MHTYADCNTYVVRVDYPFHIYCRWCGLFSCLLSISRPNFISFSHLCLYISWLNFSFRGAKWNTFDKILRNHVSFVRLYCLPLSLPLSVGKLKFFLLRSISFCFLFLMYSTLCMGAVMRTYISTVYTLYMQQTMTCMIVLPSPPSLVVYILSLFFRCRFDQSTKSTLDSLLFQWINTMR